jgi:hypothetical protein
MHQRGPARRCKRIPAADYTIVECSTCVTVRYQELDAEKAVWGVTQLIRHHCRLETQKKPKQSGLVRVGNVV